MALFILFLAAAGVGSLRGESGGLETPGEPGCVAGKTL